MSPLSSTKTRKKSIKRRNGRSRSCHKLLRMSNSICSRGDTFGSSHRSLLFSFALFFLLFVTAFHLASAVPMQEMPENYVDYMNDNAEYKTICYFTNWGAHREIKEARLFPEDIPPDLCTHILYAFGEISGSNIQHTIANDISNYQDQGPLFERIVKLKEKNPALKILISCGGWGRNGQFEGIVGSEEVRRLFSQNVINFCRKWGFDGIDLDWEFPGAHHKTNFGLLAKTMKEVFEEESKKSGKPRLLSSIATAAGEYLLKQGYDIPVLCEYLDMVNVMTYDLYGGWYNKVGHHSALYHEEGETGQDRELNTNSSMYHWIEGGCARNKLNIGIPTYGRAFGGNDPIKAWGQSGGGSGLSSRYLGEAGVQTYYEVCMKINTEGFKRYWHPVHQCSIAFKQGIWIGFDDPEGARVKCEYVKKEKLSGAMFWTLDMDDFNGKFCKNGSFPVIKSVRDCFNKKPKTTTRPTTTTTTLLITQEKDQTTDAFESASNPDYESEKEEESKSSSGSSTNTTKHLAVYFILVYLLWFDLF